MTTLDADFGASPLQLAIYSRFATFLPNHKPV